MLRRSGEGNRRLLYLRGPADLSESNITLGSSGHSARLTLAARVLTFCSLPSLSERARERDALPFVLLYRSTQSSGAQK